ncbi:MAG: hypothetical protein QM741_11775 [Rudaea sp.]|uniref:hypothetical protein n=1 Tax=Rudaea sp. TaxID=2136325 RepID=UPI0039E480E9
MAKQFHIDRNAHSGVHARRPRSAWAGSLVLLLGTVPALTGAATPAAEKEFVDAYRKAFEAKDAKTLTGLIYTQGADPQMADFYKMMVTDGIGGKVVSIQLLDLDAADRKRAEGGRGPDGKPMRFVLPPVKKLVIKSETRNANGSVSGTNEILVAESAGKLVIPAPGAAH